jgi:hypothetical protein
MKPVSIQFPVDKNRYQAQTCYTDGKTQNNYTGVQLMPDQASENVIQNMHSISFDFNNRKMITQYESGSFVYIK